MLDQNTLFIRRVAKMRQRQKEFYRPRTTSTLRESIELERIVDAMLEKLLPLIDTEPQQTELF